MPALGTYYPATPSVARAVPTKQPAYRVAQQPPATRPISRTVVGISPPSIASSVHSSAVPSLTNGSTSGDGASSDGGAQGVDLLEMMTDRLSIAADPNPMDRAIAKQAQT